MELGKWRFQSIVVGTVVLMYWEGSKSNEGLDTTRRLEMRWNALKDTQTGVLT